MDKQKLAKSLEEALQEKGKRKFTQSVELIINFKGIDFGKQDSRMNLEIPLPKGTGRNLKLAVFADGQVGVDAKAAGADIVFAPGEIDKLAGDRPRLKALSKTHIFLAQPSLMMQVGKSLGQFLGTRDKLPKPIVGKSVTPIWEALKRTVRVRNKGKNLPTLQCLVGTEAMSAQDLAENIDVVYEAVKNKVGGDHAIKSVFVKLSMGKPARIV
ncbi:50S ribosomal protein L1 [Candidatus Micrarchaeota archaeon]|nr:50S ribosomal protein L1 [Candidatus Micrarchaeota archaeon]